MAKKITGYIKLQVPAGAANPSPPIGPALGQRGVNIMEVCKACNAATGDLEKNAPIPTVITVYADRSFSFATKTPPATFLIKKAANLKKGSKEPGKAAAGKIKRAALQQIAETKMKDLNATDIDAATRIIAGTARAMGVAVVEGRDHGKDDNEADDLGDRSRQAPRRRTGDHASQGQRHRDLRPEEPTHPQTGRK